jgi:hypothetical protein
MNKSFRWISTLIAFFKLIGLTPMVTQWAVVYNLDQEDDETETEDKVIAGETTVVEGSKISTWARVNGRHSAPLIKRIHRQGSLVAHSARRIPAGRAAICISWSQ